MSCSHPWLQCSYPWLQPLTAAEIPATPVVPADIPLVGATSVTTVAGLRAMTAGHHYSIDADIDLTGVAWTPLVFSSSSQTVIEGNNHVISNLTVGTAGTTRRALFASIAGTGGGEIRNLVLQNFTVTAWQSAAALCGFLSATGFRVKNVTATGCTINATGGTYSGALLGSVNGRGTLIANCVATNCSIVNTGSVGSRLGGLVGYIREQSTLTTSNFVNCQVQGGTMTLNSQSPINCGGFIGEVLAPVGGGTGRNCGFYDCSTTMDIAYTAPAGLSGYQVSGIGGFFGYVENASSTSCYATGDITLTTSGNWTATDSIDSVGGFLGKSCCHETHTNCYCLGTITINGGASDNPLLDCIGGFAGFIDHDWGALRCYSKSPVVVNVDTGDCGSIGGFGGGMQCSDAASSISRCWAEGDLTFNGDVTLGSSGTYIGGFVGKLWTTDDIYTGSISNCYTWSSIIANGSYDAGIVFSGFISYYDDCDFSITNCYCAQTDTEVPGGSGYTGQIPAGASSYGFGDGEGLLDTTITASFYDTQTSSLNTSTIGVSKTTLWLQTQEHFTDVGWDFDTIWDILPCAGGAGQVIMVEEL